MAHAAPSPLPRRLAGVNHLLSAPRAKLISWLHEADAEPLIDNRAYLARTGLAEDRGPWTHPDRMDAAAAPPSSSFGPLLGPCLDVPAAPSLALPPAEPAAAGAARRLVIDALSEARSLAVELHRQGASPDAEKEATRKLDKFIAPAVVAALNAEDPGLRLHYAHHVRRETSPQPPNERFGSIDWSDFLRSAPAGRSRVVLDNQAHNLTLDVLFTGAADAPQRRGSILLIDSVRSPASQHHHFAAVHAQRLRLPADWPVLVMDTGAQASDRSCRVFAWSMALKCHAQRNLEDLHHAQLEGRPTALHTEDLLSGDAGEDSQAEKSSSSSSHSGSDSSDGMSTESMRPELHLGRRLLVAQQVLGAPFMKHAQSREVVLRDQALRRDAAFTPVNRKGQTLLERHDAHRVLRSGYEGKRFEPRVYSASIELKRIDFIDRALRHAAHAPAAEVQNMAHAMHAVDTGWVDWLESSNQ